MTNDAKFGLVVGVGLVIAVAVIFFRKDINSHVSGEPRSALAVSSAAPATPNGRSSKRVPKATMTARAAAAPSPIKHTVKEGETLFSLAQRYYGEGEKYVEILKVNRDIIPNPEVVEPGTVLEIPNANSTEARPSDDGSR